ncbi:hypothetical protein LINPERPRIM_LOCUS1393 [Linum perenne]
MSTLLGVTMSRVRIVDWVIFYDLTVLASPSLVQF